MLRKSEILLGYRNVSKIRIISSLCYFTYSSYGTRFRGTKTLYWITRFVKEKSKVIDGRPKGRSEHSDLRETVSARRRRRNPAFDIRGKTGRVDNTEFRGGGACKEVTYSRAGRIKTLLVVRAVGTRMCVFAAGHGVRPKNRAVAVALPPATDDNARYNLFKTVPVAALRNGHRQQRVEKKTRTTTI